MPTATELPKELLGSGNAEIWLNQLRRCVAERTPQETFSGDLLRYRFDDAGYSVEFIEDILDALSESAIHQAVVKEVKDDYLICYLRGQPEENVFNVAKPFELRRTSYESPDNDYLGGKVKVADAPNDENSQFRKVEFLTTDIDGGPKTVFVEQVVSPFYAVNLAADTAMDVPTRFSTIYVSKVPENAEVIITDPVEPNVAVEWIDVNSCGRRWLSRLQPFKLCQDEALFISVFSAGEAVLANPD